MVQFLEQNHKVHTVQARHTPQGSDAHPLSHTSLARISFQDGTSELGFKSKQIQP